MGFDYDGKTCFFGECKWRNDLLDHSVLDTLVYRANLFSDQSKVLYLFSKSGFSAETIDKAKELNVYLVGFNDM